MMTNNDSNNSNGDKKKRKEKKNWERRWNNLEKKKLFTVSVIALCLSLFFPTYIISVISLICSHTINHPKVCFFFCFCKTLKQNFYKNLHWNNGWNLLIDQIL